MSKGLDEVKRLFERAKNEVEERGILSELMITNFPIANIIEEAETCSVEFECLVDLICKDIWETNQDTIKYSAVVSYIMDRYEIKHKVVAYSEVKDMPLGRAYVTSGGTVYSNVEKTNRFDKVYIYEL